MSGSIAVEDWLWRSTIELLARAGVSILNWYFSDHRVLCTRCSRGHGHDRCRDLMIFRERGSGRRIAVDVGCDCVFDLPTENEEA